MNNLATVWLQFGQYSPFFAILSAAFVTFAQPSAESRRAARVRAMRALPRFAARVFQFSVLHKKECLNLSLSRMESAFVLC
ncbi:MAG TPA: hypothetical protein IAA32_04960 [Candidatus Butyricicoccus stercorigallinarum]|nr:hypothetical protein [Candidatus Butyricicoccus stercorigallinarum]